jgi:DNA-binding response OmpR family regulator
MSILTVDDNVTHSYALAHMLRAYGFVVIEAYNAASALQIAQADSPEVVLLDVNLPDGSGYDVLSALRHDGKTKNIGVVIHSAVEATAEGKYKAESLGADAYLTFPVTPDELLAVVNGTLARVRHRAAL